MLRWLRQAISLGCRRFLATVLKVLAISASVIDVGPSDDERFANLHDPVMVEFAAVE